MANPLSASTFIKALQGEGVRVREVGSWRTHHRNHKGPFGPVHGVMLHHTGAYTSAEQMVELCRTGYASLPGPLCHGVIDKQGTVHLVGYGRTNHAGLGDPDVLRAVVREGALPRDDQATTDGNRHFYGFECINKGDGKDQWTGVQVEAMVRASAAVLRAHRWGKAGRTSVIGHLEWQPGKPDPFGNGFPGLGKVRERVAARLEHPPTWSPNGSSPGGLYKVREGDTLITIAAAHRMAWKTLWQLNREQVPDPDVIKPGQELRLK